MNITAFLKITALLPVIGALTLSGCGGSGGVRDTDEPLSGAGGQPPLSDETERLNAAIDRARAAENAARSSAAQAALQCQAASAACQAAQDATTAALLAEGANEHARNATTADEAERAAEVAEQGASRAATAAADAARLAGRGIHEQPSGEPTTGGASDWLFPGTVPSAEAGSAAKRSVEAAYLDGTIGGRGNEEYERFRGQRHTSAPYANDVDVSTNQYYSRIGYVGSWATGAMRPSQMKLSMSRRYSTTTQPTLPRCRGTNVFWV